MPLNLPSEPHIIVPSPATAANVDTSFLDRPTQQEDPDLKKGRQLDNQLKEKQVADYDQEKKDKQDEIAWKNKFNGLAVVSDAIRTGQDQETIDALTKEYLPDSNLKFKGKGSETTMDLINPKDNSGWTITGPTDKWNVAVNWFKVGAMDPVGALNGSTILAEQGFKIKRIEASDTPAQKESRDKSLIGMRTQSELSILDARTRAYVSTRAQVYENPQTKERVTIPPGGMPPTGYYPISSSVVGDAAKNNKVESPFGAQTKVLSPQEATKLNMDIQRESERRMASDSNNVSLKPEELAAKKQEIFDIVTKEFLGEAVQKNMFDPETNTVNTLYNSGVVIQRQPTADEIKLAQQKLAQRQGATSQSQQGAQDIQGGAPAPQQSFLQPGQQPQPTQQQPSPQPEEPQSVLAPRTAEAAPITNTGGDSVIAREQPSPKAGVEKPIITQPSKAVSTPSKKYTIGEVPDAIIEAFKNRPTASENINSFTKAMGEKGTGLGFSREDVKLLGKWLVGQTKEQKDRSLKAAMSAKEQGDKAWQNFLSTKIPVYKD